MALERFKPLASPTKSRIEAESSARRQLSEQFRLPYSDFPYRFARRLTDEPASPIAQ
jgi:hypothetical protein